MHPTYPTKCVYVEPKVDECKPLPYIAAPFAALRTTLTFASPLLPPPPPLTAWRILPAP